MENYKSVVPTNSIFSNENILKVKIFIYAGLGFFLIYAFLKKFHKFTQNKVSRLKSYELLKEQIWMSWMLLKSILGDSGDTCHLVVNYLRSLKDTPRDIWIGFLHFIYIDQPEDLQVVLNNSNTLQKSGLYKFFKKSLGEGLITAPVPQWKKMRRLVSPLFTAKFVERFLNVFNRHGSQLVQRLKNYSDTNEYIDLWNPVSRTTLAMVLDVAIDADKLDIPENEKGNILEAILKAAETLGQRIYRIWLFPTFMFELYCKIKGYQKYFKLYETFMEKYFKIMKKNFQLKMESAKKSGKDLVVMSYGDALLKETEENNLGARVTDKEIIDEERTIIAAGNETNALSISFTLIMLAMHPQIQEKVYREIIKFSGEDDVELNIQQVYHMPFLEQCIKETLRLFPPVPFTMRKVTESFQLNNFTVKKNSNVIIPILMVHRNPNIYPNPMQWNPDNFSPNMVESRHKYSFLAFSGGARGCIGVKYAMLAIKVVLIKILKNYRVEVDYTIDDIKLKLETTIRSIDGYKIKMNSRMKR